MKNMKGTLSGTALAILLVAAAPDAAWAADCELVFDEEAATCAKLYETVQYERDFGFDDGAFWQFSNARQIDFAARAAALKARADSPVVFDMQKMGKPTFPPPSRNDAGFNDPNPLRRSTPPASSATPPYGRSLSRCDEAHGFTPVFSFGVSPTPQMTHLQCATSYFTLALLAPNVREVLRARIQRAAAADAEREVSDEDIRAKLGPNAQQRGQGIQSGLERPQPLVSEVHACDAQYGHEPVRL